MYSIDGCLEQVGNEKYGLRPGRLNCKVLLLVPSDSNLNFAIGFFLLNPNQALGGERYATAIENTRQ
jgi:hypothetical protein